MLSLESATFKYLTGFLHEYKHGTLKHLLHCKVTLLKWGPRKETDYQDDHDYHEFDYDDDSNNDYDDADCDHYPDAKAKEQRDSVH